MKRRKNIQSVYQKYAVEKNSEQRIKMLKKGEYVDLKIVKEK